jgi:hypothetical protein
VVQYERLLANLPCLHGVIGPSVPRMRMLITCNPDSRSLRVAMGRFTHEERSRQGVNVDLSDQGALGQPRMPISWPGNDLSPLNAAKLRASNIFRDSGCRGDYLGTMWGHSRTTASGIEGALDLPTARNPTSQSSHGLLRTPWQRSDFPIIFHL